MVKLARPGPVPGTVASAMTAHRAWQVTGPAWWRVQGRLAGLVGL